MKFGRRAGTSNCPISVPEELVISGKCVQSLPKIKIKNLALSYNRQGYEVVVPPQIRERRLPVPCLNVSPLIHNRPRLRRMSTVPESRAKR